jgi:hypothetical protein
MKFATLAVASAFVLASGPALADHSPNHGKGQLAFEVPYDAATPAEAPKTKAPGVTGQVYHRRNCWNYYRWYYSYYYGWQRYYVGTRCYY